MSNTEDYLDGLLSSLEGKKNTEEKTDFTENTVSPEPVEEPLLKAEGTDAEQDFLDSFEREFLSGENADEFIRQFERELDEEEEQESAEFTEVDERGVPEESMMEEKQSMSAEMTDDDMDFMVDTLGEIPSDDIGIPMEADTTDDMLPLSEDFDEPLPDFPDMADGKEADSMTEEDEGLMDLLQSEGDFSDIGDMPNMDEEHTESGDDFSDGMEGFTLEEIPIDDTMVLEDAAENQDETSDKSKKETSGFLKKLSQVLFGDDAEEPQKTLEKPVKTPEAAVAPSIEDISDENLEILQQLEGVGETESEEPQEAPETEEEAKARKKREKEEKKAKRKEERAAKKAQAKAQKAEKKAKKPKKVKKPKEPDRTPPLPKKPVILCFVMMGSFLVLVLLGMNLFSYSSDMASAEKQFGLGNYEEAYQMVSGLEIKEQDDEAYQKYRVMGTVAGEYTAYQTFMEAGLYDMALDSLVRTVGRCEKYQPDAQLYGCTGELVKLAEQAVGALSGFGITEERALELYAMEEREEYSAQINTILEQAGYTID